MLSNNILVSADYEKGEFVFENADESITGLKKGDYFCINPTETDVIAINVESVNTSDGLTTVTESGKSIDEMFEFMKLEAKSGMNQKVAREVTTTDDSTKTEFEKIVEKLQSGSPTLEVTMTVDQDEKLSFEAGFATISKDAIEAEIADDCKLSYDNDEHEAKAELSGGDISISKKDDDKKDDDKKDDDKKDDDKKDDDKKDDDKKDDDKKDDDKKDDDKKDDDKKEEGEFTVGLKADIDYDIKFYKLGPVITGVNVEFKSINTITISGKGSIEFKEKEILPIAVEAPTPIPGINLSWNPTISVKVEGEIKCEFQNIFIFIAKVNALGKNYVCPLVTPYKSPKIYLKVEVSVAFNLLPGISVISSQFGTVTPKCELEVKISVEGTEENGRFLSYPYTKFKEQSSGSIKGKKVYIISGNSDVHHMCQKLCVKCKFEMSISFGIKFEVLKKFEVEAEKEVEICSADFYLSEYGFGYGDACPNDAYKTTILITHNSSPVENATVTIEGISQMTDADGKAVFYCSGSLTDFFYVDVETPAYLNKSPRKEHFSVQKRAITLEIPFFTLKDDEEKPDDTAKKSETYVEPRISNPADFEDKTQQKVEPLGNEADFPEVLACGQLADHIYYSIIKDDDGYGDMRIWGHGYMEGEIYESNVKWSSSDNIIKKMLEYKVKNVSIENDVYVETEQRDDNKYIITKVYEEPILSIGHSLFIGNPYSSDGNHNNNYLESITIPNTIEKIDSSAFGYHYVNGTLDYACSSINLSKIEVRTLDKEASVKNNQIEYSYGGLETTNLKEIGYCAFYGCKKLTEQNFPDSLESIGNYAFYGCDFTSVYTPDSVSYIGDQAFAYNTNLKTARISPKITLRHRLIDDEVQIGYGVFCGCKSLTGLETPNIDVLWNMSSGSGLSELWHNSSGNDGKPIDYNLKTVTIIGNPTKISDRLFYDCTTLEKVTIPDSVTEIGVSAFYNCSSLKTITLPESLETIGESAFSKSDLSKGIVLSKNVKTISNSAFSDSNLSNITFNNSLETIGEHAFSGCENLKSVSIPDSVTSIETYAFINCTSLEDVTIGTGISVKNNTLNTTFANCNNLKKLRMPALSSGNGSVLYSMIQENSDRIIVPVTSLIINGTPSSIPCTYCYDAVNMEELYIPTSVTKVEENTFKNITKLQTVYYDGTKEELETLISGIETGNQPLLDALKHRVMYGDLNEDGVSDLTDLSILSVYLLSHSEYAGKINVKAADIDGNGIVDIADLARLKQHISKDSNVKYPYKNDPRNKK